MRTAYCLALACTFVTSIPTVSLALGIRLADQDARATARGNAFTATADNPSAIYYNPAGILWLYTPEVPAVPTSDAKGTVSKQTAPVATSGGGFQVRGGFYAITLDTAVNLSGGRGDLGADDRWQASGSFYATWKKENSDFAFGLGVYSPYGFGIWYPEDSQIRTRAISGNINYGTINPVVAWQATRSLSLAIGPTINYAKTNIKQGIAIQGDAFEFDGDGWAAGFNAGLMWRPHEMHSFGVMYRSKTELTFEGTAHTYIPTVIDLTEAGAAGFTFPQNIVIGYSFRPTDKWNLEANFDWTDWDNLNTVDLVRTTGVTSIPTFNWQSSWFYEFGASYRFDCGIVASAGYIYSENSVPDASFDPLIPDSDRHIFSVGLGKQWKNWDLDVAFQYAHGPQRTVVQGTVADGTYEFNSYAISVSAGYRF